MRDFYAFILRVVSDLGMSSVHACPENCMHVSGVSIFRLSYLVLSASGLPTWEVAQASSVVPRIVKTEVFLANCTGAKMKYCDLMACSKNGRMLAEYSAYSVLAISY